MKYKMHIMISQSTTQEDGEKIIAKIAGVIENLGGKVLTKTFEKLVKLETPIKKSDMAWYAFVQFELDTEKQLALGKELQLMKGVERHMVCAAEDDKKAVFDVVNEKDYRKRTAKFWQENVVMENPQLLKFFLSPRGRILPGKSSAGLMGNVSAAMMRQLSNAVKQARFMGWLPLK